ncbi:MAG: sugar phosphate isomerase/epimerase [Thermoguttaceae bacterium]|jgi:sugar phosphate isomerase/epimerase
MIRDSFRYSAVDRRQFLGRLAGGTAAGLLGGGWLASVPRASAAAAWTMRLSCSSINFSALPIEQACQRIAALGFQAIDIWSAHAGCPHLDDVQKRLGPAGLKDLLARHKLKLYAFSVYAGGYPRYAELLGKAGGGVAIRGSDGACKPDELTARMKAFLEALKPEAELAEKHNSFLAIENHGGSLLCSLDSFKAFADLNRNPRLGLALAPYHLQAIKASVEETIAVAGRQLFFFYAWQNAPGEQQLPGIGPTDCAPWLAALAKIGYGWYVNPFMHGEPKPDAMSAALAKSCRYLREKTRVE